MLLCIDVVKLISSLQNRMLIPRHPVAGTDGFTPLHLLPIQAKEMRVFVIFPILPMATNKNMLIKKKHNCDGRIDLKQWGIRLASLRTELSAWEKIHM